MDLREELQEAYKRFRSGCPGVLCQNQRGAPVELLWVQVHSKAAHFLLQGDTEIGDNISFSVPLFMPGQEGRASECLILGHGFNESDYVKLFPWAYCLCQGLRMPVLVFPCAFHINRRPGSWVRLGRSLYHRRRNIPGNRFSSPFNAVVSQRISEAPERFLRGGLQSYEDLMDLLQQIRRGTLLGMAARGPVQPLAQGAIPHFLGYSVSGYLFLGALLMDREGWLEGSGCLLFNSFTAWDEANPVSILVIDQEAYQRGTRFYLEDYRREATKEFQTWYEGTEEGMLFQGLFLKQAGTSPLSRRVDRVRDRLLVVADPKDPIFPGRAIGKHLGEGIATVFMSLGRHEFPFNITPMEEMSFVQLARAMRESWAPSPCYEKAFFHWVGLIARFLRRAEGLRGMVGLVPGACDPGCADDAAAMSSASASCASCSHEGNSDSRNHLHAGCTVTWS